MISLPALTKSESNLVNVPLISFTFLGEVLLALDNTSLVITLASLALLAIALEPSL